MDVENFWNRAQLLKSKILDSAAPDKAKAIALSIGCAIQENDLLLPSFGISAESKGLCLEWVQEHIFMDIENDEIELDLIALTPRRTEMLDAGRTFQHIQSNGG